jgi:hypothetical protein
VLTTVSCFSQSVPKIGIDDFYIYSSNKKIRIHLMDSVTKVIGVLGKADVTIRKEIASSTYIELHYPGLRIGFFDGSDALYSIAIVGPEYVTSRGLTIDTSADRILTLYGEPSEIFENSESYEIITYEYINKTSTLNSGSYPFNVLIMNLNFNSPGNVSAIYFSARE